MEQYKDIVIVHTKLPTYLMELLQKQEEIILVHGKKKIVELNGTANVCDTSSDSLLELTGCPLEIDLNVLPASYIPSSNFTSEELQHIPIKLHSARKFINSYKGDSLEGVTKSIPVYCICNGGDKKRTVVIGSHRANGHVIRVLVNVQDCVDINYPENNIDRMIAEHIQNVGVNLPRIETKVTCIHELYGYKLNDQSKISELYNTGSILVEETWNSREFNIPEYGATIKMMLQAIVGHENSLMYSIFQELVFLHHCLNILKNSKTNGKQENLDRCVISSNPLDVSEINKNISEILQIVNIVKKPSAAPNNIRDAVDSLENKSFVEKLWNTFKYCGKAEDLRICLSHLFESVGDIPKSALVFDDDENTIIGKMINDIYTERLMVPHLSSKQSLELLIDLGLQKLKKNYFFIIKSCGFNIGEQLLSMWNGIASPSTETKRGTLAELKVSDSSAQLRFLLCSHILLEFLQLVEQNYCFSRDVSLSVMKQAYNMYIVDNIMINSFTMLETKQFCKLTVPLTYADVKIIDSKPAKWQLTIASNLKNSAVATVFHYSRKPIFPDTIYKYGEELNDSIPCSDTMNEKFFVTRLSYYSDKICDVENNK